MAGTALKFENGSMGFERCVDCVGGKQFLRAFIHHAATGRTTSASVEIRDVVAFATETVRQALLADGHNEIELTELTWTSRAREPS